MYKFVFQKAGLCAALFIMANAASAAPIKGLSLARNNQHVNELAHLLRANWYYTWGNRPLPAITDTEFVPMAWGSRMYQEHAYPKDIKELLLFNEPDHKGQSNLSPGQAVDLLVRSPLQLSNVRIGSPAPTQPYSKWLKDFVSQAHKQHITIDFIAVHWYGPPNAKKFLIDIDNAYSQYKKPIWITEFAVADWNASKHGGNHYSDEQVIEFMKDAIEGLKQRQYVERYAWYTPNKDKEELKSSRLWNDDGKLTQLGQLYAKF